METNNVKLNSGDTSSINITVEEFIGECLAKKFIDSLTEEQINSVMEYAYSDLFKTEKNYSNDPEETEKIVVKTENDLPRDRWGDIDYKHPNLGYYTKEKFNEKFKELIVKKVDELISTDKYQEKATQIAEELVEYATYGYKEDLKERIRQRLVGNLVDTAPAYAGMGLIEIIRNEVNNMIHQ